jgi:hypothetical protein
MRSYKLRVRTNYAAAMMDDIVISARPDNIRVVALHQRSFTVRGSAGRGVEKGWSSQRGGL